MKDIWAPQDDVRLRALRAEHKTFEKISMLMGRSRGACIGRMKRLNDKFPRCESCTLYQENGTCTRLVMPMDSQDTYRFHTAFNDGAAPA